MVAAMAAFAIEDSFIKAVTKSIPIAQALIIFGIGGVIIFACLASIKGERLFQGAVLSRPMRIRVGFEIIGRLFFTLAISLTPLSSATVILQATPIVVVAGAAILFREYVGWRRWSAIFIGLLGVVIIIRPGTESFNALSILAVLGMFGFAGRDLASRAAPASISASILGFYGFIALTLAGILFAAWEQRDFVSVNQANALYLMGAILFGVAAYYSLMKALRTGEVSAVTPFRYTRLLFGIALGLLFFEEQLDTHTLMGCCLIVVSGLFILWRGKTSAPTNNILN